MTTGQLYATPKHIDSPEDCFFYHFMELPEVGTVGSTWDLRKCTNEYLGNEDYSGKRVLDVGAASGFVTFELERRGAQVVSFDLPSVESWNLVPHASLRQHWPDLLNSRAECHRKMQNAYWYAHRKLRSRARVHYGDIYNLPLELGTFDIVYLGMVLPHLRDPFQALYSASRLAGERLIVTNPGRKPTWWRRLLGQERRQAKFMPSKENRKTDVWWALSATCIERMLAVLGFEVERRVVAIAECNENGRVRSRKNVAIVAQRVQNSPEGLCVKQNQCKGDQKESHRLAAAEAGKLTAS